MTDSMARSNSGAAVRGAVVVLIAVAVGVLLLRSSDGNGVVAAGSVDTVREPGVTEPLTETTLPAVNDTTPADTEPVAPTDSIADETGETTAPDDGVTVTTVAAVEGFAPRPANEVKVQVANTTGIKGAAGVWNDQFKTLNYTTLTPTNMSGTPLPKTRIYYQPGSLLEAQAAATVLGLDPKNDVFQMFQDTSAITQWDEADVLVALGEDLAAS